MKMPKLLAAALLLVATPACAERLQFDHRLYPPLQQVLDAGDNGMIDFNTKNPARPVDLIAVRGRSARDWTEALEIVSIVRPADVADARAWFDLMQRQAQARCHTTFTVLAEDAVSVTFERRSRPDCTAERAPFGLYRLVAGKRSWFQLAVLAKDGLSDAARAQWLALLASAHLD